MNGSLLFGVLVAIATMIAFAGFWRAKRPQGPEEVWLAYYRQDIEVPITTEADAHAKGHSSWSWLDRLMGGVGLGTGLAEELSVAGLPLTSVEFKMLILGTGGLGFLLGTWRLGPILGLAVGALLAYVPILYMRSAKKGRQRAFTQQLPDVLTLLAGALRAGNGLSQAMQMLVDELPPPVCDEFGRVMRGVGLGVSVPQALNDMAERIATDDVQILVTAVIVQYEMGGNLAETLDTIGETIGDRIRIQREIAVLTAEERLTGYILAALPLFVAGIVSVLNPRFISQLFAPGWVRLLPVAAVFMQLVGLLVIRRITSIEV